MKTKVDIYSEGESPVIEWSGENESNDNFDLTALLDIALNDMEKTVIKKE